MEFVEVKEEVIDDDSTWNQCVKHVAFNGAIKNEGCIPECFDEVHIKDEFDENNSIHLDTVGSGIQVQHSIPTVGKEELKGFQNISEHSNQKLYLSRISNGYQIQANNLVPPTVINAIKNPHICHLCKLTYDNEVDFVRHTCESRFECYTCKYTSIRKAGLAQHIKIHANKSHLVPPMTTHAAGRPFACDVCEYKGARKYNLVVHMRTHTGELPFACNICEYKSTLKVNLERHMRNHTGEFPFACVLCGYKCSQKSHLDRHMVTHTGERRFARHVTKYKNAQKADVVKPTKTHSGERPFACDVCKYKSSLKATLVKHMKTHADELPFACTVCKYKGARKSYLVKHMRTHNFERPFACHVCNYRSARKDTLATHIRNHTGEFPFTWVSAD